MLRLIATSCNMKRHRDLLAVLRANGMRITAGRRVLLQFILDSQSRRVSLREIHQHVDDRMRRIDRSSGSASSRRSTCPRAGRPISTSWTAISTTSTSARPAATHDAAIASCSSVSRRRSAKRTASPKRISPSCSTGRVPVAPRRATAPDAPVRRESAHDISWRGDCIRGPHMLVSAPRRYRLRLVEGRMLSPSVRGLRFVSEGAPPDYRAGQSMDLFVPTRGGLVMRRPYSIASAPGYAGARALDFAVTRVEGGPTSEALHELTSGAVVEAIGPNRGWLARRDDERAVAALLVATGSGLAPFRAVLQEELQRREGPPIALLFGCRTQAD